VFNWGGGSVSEIITGSNEVNNSFLIGEQPVRGLVSRDNSILFVSNFGSDSVAIYSIDNGRRLGVTGVGSHPEAMAFSPNQLLLLVVNAISNDLAVVALTDRKGRPWPDTPQGGAWYPLETMVPLGGAPRAIVVKAFVAP
jgi:DNA-binding beta-propeller fold protein YncE